MLNHDVMKLQTLLAILRIQKQPRTFILDTFFPTTQTFGTADVRYDIDISTRRVAGFTHPKMQGDYGDKRGFAARRMAVPYIKPARSWLPGDLFDRFPGSDSFGTDSASLGAYMTRELGDMDDSIVRREEWMAIRALLDGKIEIQGDGYDDTVDFQRDASHTTTLAGVNLWTAATSNIYDNIEDQGRIILRDSGRIMDTVVFGTNAWKAAHANEKFMAKLDNRRVEIGSLRPSPIKGARFVGSLNEGSIGLWAYDEWFIDPLDDVEKPLFPEDQVLCGAQGSRTTRLYGAIQDFSASQRGRLRKARRFPKTFMKDDPSEMHLLLQSAPLPAVVEWQGFSTLNPL